MQKREGGTPVEEKTRKFPDIVKLIPFGPDARLRLEAPNAKKRLTISVEASHDSRSLKVIYNHREPSSQDSTFAGVLHRLDDGTIASYYLTGFGVYNERREYDLETPDKDVRLMIRREDNGDVTLWLKSADLSKAENVPGPKDFVTVHKIDGKPVGYTFKDLLQNINFMFTTAIIQFQVE